jgi:hypothetical protein
MPLTEHHQTDRRCHLLLCKFLWSFHMCPEDLGGCVRAGCRDIPICWWLLLVFSCPLTAYVVLLQKASSQQKARQVLFALAFRLSPVVQSRIIYWREYTVRI